MTKQGMCKSSPQEVLAILQKVFTVPKLPTARANPFELLIATIISQNTTDNNARRAFENLSRHFRIVPAVLSNAKTVNIERCLRVAGLYRNKAKAIKQISLIMSEKYHGNVGSILTLPLKEAREVLLKLPGVGPKTADVTLLFGANKPTLPIDTHVWRVAKRLGWAPLDGDYETIRRSVESIFEPRDYLSVHILLISHGRKYCKARNPSCKQCPVNARCPSRGSWSHK